MPGPNASSNPSGADCASPPESKSHSWDSSFPEPSGLAHSRRLEHGFHRGISSKIAVSPPLPVRVAGTGLQLVTPCDPYPSFLNERSAPADPEPRFRRGNHLDPALGIRGEHRHLRRRPRHSDPSIPYPDSDRIPCLCPARSGRNRRAASPSISWTSATGAGVGEFRNPWAAPRMHQLAVTGVAEPARIKGLRHLRGAPLAGNCALLGAADNSRRSTWCRQGLRARRPRLGNDSSSGGPTSSDNPSNSTDSPIRWSGSCHPSFKYWDAWAYVPSPTGCLPNFGTRARRSDSGDRTFKGGFHRGTGTEGTGRHRAPLGGSLSGRKSDRTVRVRLLAETVGGQIRPQLQLLLGAVPVSS